MQDPDIRMSNGTSDSTVIPSTKIEAHNLNITNASNASHTNGSPSIDLHGETAENCQLPDLDNYATEYIT